MRASASAPHLLMEDKGKCQPVDGTFQVLGRGRGGSLPFHWGPRPWRGNGVFIRLAAQPCHMAELSWSTSTNRQVLTTGLLGATSRTERVLAKDSKGPSHSLDQMSSLLPTQASTRILGVARQRIVVMLPSRSPSIVVIPDDIGTDQMGGHLAAVHRFSFAGGRAVAWLVQPNAAGR